MIPGAIGKLLNRFKISSEAFAFQIIKRQSETLQNKILDFPSKINYNKTRTQEGTRELLIIFSSIIKKHKLVSFTLIKEREIYCLRKKTAVLSFKVAISEILERNLKSRLEIWRKATQDRKNQLTNLFEILIAANSDLANFGFRCISDFTQHKVLKEKRLGRILRHTDNRMIKIHYKKVITIWKKACDNSKMKEMNQDYQKIMNFKSIYSRINYAIKRRFKDSFIFIHEFSKNYNISEQSKYSLLLFQSFVTKKQSKEK